MVVLYYDALLGTLWFLDVLSLAFLAHHDFSQMVVQGSSLKVKFNLGSQGPEASALFSRLHFCHMSDLNTHPLLLMPANFKRTIQWEMYSLQCDAELDKHTDG